MPHYLDILIAIPLLWAAYRGFKKGLVIELAGLAALILGIYCALKFSDFIADFIVEQWAYEGKYLPIIAFALTFLLVVLLVHLLGKAIEKVLDIVALGTANKLAGATFNILKVAIILSVGIWFYAKWIPEVESAETPPSSTEEEKEEANESVLYPPLKALAPLIIPPLMESKWVDQIRETVSPSDTISQAQP